MVDSCAPMSRCGETHNPKKSSAEYGDMLEARIRDPVKATRLAPRAAARGPPESSMSAGSSMLAR